MILKIFDRVPPNKRVHTKKKKKICENEDSVKYKI